AELAGTSIWTVLRHLKGRRTRVGVRIEQVLPGYRADREAKSFNLNKRSAIRVPGVVDEGFAEFLGYLIGYGHISEPKRTVGLTSADEDEADRFLDLAATLFAVRPVKKWDKTKWRVKFSSAHVQDFLKSLGLKTGFCAREKTVPDVVLRSPKSVV